MGASRLEVVAGKAVGMTIVVEDELLIGRQSEGLADDDEISRSHARVSVDPRGFSAIEDLGSTNGTFVNGLRISSPQMLSEGDLIEIGGTTLVVREVPQPEAPPDASPPGAEAVRPQPTVAGRGAAPPVVSGPPAGPAPRVVGAPAGPPAPASPLPPTSEAHPAEPLPIEPEPEPEPKPAPVTPLLSLQLEVDFDAREARLFLDQTSPPLRLVLDDDTWRAVSSPVTEKGSPA